MKWLLKSDKLLHILAGLIMVQVFFIGWSFVFSIETAFALAVLLSMLMGICKEIVWDRWLKKGVCEMKDFVATLLGIGIGTILAILIII